jgi:hypothetical protein
MKVQGCIPQHDYITVGDDEWRNLPLRTVNKDGDSLDDWFLKFEANYMKEEVEAPEISPPEDVEEVMTTVRNFLISESQ